MPAYKLAFLRVLCVLTSAKRFEQITGDTAIASIRGGINYANPDTVKLYLRLLLCLTC